MVQYLYFTSEWSQLIQRRRDGRICDLLRLSCRFRCCSPCFHSGPTLSCMYLSHNVPLARVLESGSLVATTFLSFSVNPYISCVFSRCRRRSFKIPNSPCAFSRAFFMYLS